MAAELPVYVLVLLWSSVFLFVSFRILHVDLGFNWEEWKFHIRYMWAGPRFGIVRMWMYLVILHVPLFLVALYINLTKLFS